VNARRNPFVLRFRVVCLRQSVKALLQQIQFRPNHRHEIERDCSGFHHP
jgi:hypothetical protein